MTERCFLVDGGYEGHIQENDVLWYCVTGLPVQNTQLTPYCYVCYLADEPKGEYIYGNNLYQKPDRQP